MIRKFIYNKKVELTFYLDGENSYCLSDGEIVGEKYSQNIYELCILQNWDLLDEVNDIEISRKIKKHSMTE